MGKRTTVTVNQLYKQLGDLIKDGEGRRRVCVAKDSFHHNCETDGVTILEVAGLQVEMVHNSDDDGGTKVNKDGSESYSRLCVLYGGSGWPRPKGD